MQTYQILTHDDEVCIPNFKSNFLILLHLYGLVFLSRNYWSLLDHALMASIWEKAISVLAGKLNSGHSYLITAIYYKYSITIWVFIVWVWISSIITLSLILFFGKIVQKNQLELITFNSFSPLHCGVKGRSYFYVAFCTVTFSKIYHWIHCILKRKEHL